MIHPELKEKAFVNIIDTKTKQLDRYAILADGTIYYNVKIKTMDTLKLLEKSMAFNISTATLDTNVATILQASKSTGGQGISTADATKIIFNDLSVNVTGNTVFQMNSKAKLPATRIEKNDNTGQYDLIFENDVTIQCPNIIERNELIETVYSKIENGDYILYYLNEFRRCRKIPILVFVGPGGTGKTNAGVNPFISYKPAGKVCKKYFGGDNSTGELGNTSLIVEEESDKYKSPTLTLNTLKDSTTSNEHFVRRLFFDGVSARGFLTFIFSCNDNNKSLILNLLNAKGEDVISIRRRTSTFYFDKSLGEYLQLRDASGKTYGQLFSEYIKVDVYGSGSSNMDRHLNYLESINFFDNPKFKATSYNMLTVHSPKVNVCESLSNDMAVLLEELYAQFILGKKDKHILRYEREETVKPSRIMDGHSFSEWRMNPLEQAIMTITKSKPAKQSLLYNLNVVAKDAFTITRSNSNYVINLITPDILLEAYLKYNGPDEMDVPNKLNADKEVF